MRILADRENCRLLQELGLCTLLLLLSTCLLPPKVSFAASLLFAGAVFLCVWRYLVRLDSRLAAAAAQTRAFSQGQTTVPLACDGEGELCYLLQQINTLSAVAQTRAEREQQQSASLKAAVSDISHQLKTPLAALSLHNSLISEAEDMETVRHFCAAAEHELDRIEELVQNILKLARLDAGAIVFHKQPEKLLELLNDLRQRFLCRAELESKELLLGGNAEDVLYCDRIWLTEALGNLLKNALDHTAPGGKIALTWRSRGNLLTLTVTDNGSGIHPEDLPHIFERFYRSRFSSDTQGCGLGLPLARHIIEAHGGTVEVKSTLSRGTVFTLTFVQPTKL